jgi:predicted transcriptional regulator
MSDIKKYSDEELITKCNKAVVEIMDEGISGSEIVELLIRFKQKSARIEKLEEVNNESIGIFKRIYDAYGEAWYDRPEGDTNKSEGRLFDAENFGNQMEEILLNGNDSIIHLLNKNTYYASLDSAEKD